MRSVWAVARNTIAQALRMKVAAIVVILLLEETEGDGAVHAARKENSDCHAGG